MHGEDVIALTKSQVDRLVEAYEEKKGLPIRMSKTQLAHNAKIEGGFFTSVSWIDSIPNWNCFASFRSWSFIRTGEYRGTTTNWKWIVSKEGKWCVSDREGQYLGPASGKGFETVGNGLYLMKQGGLYDGRGLILGPNSLFRNIPILCMIL